MIKSMILAIMIAPTESTEVSIPVLVTEIGPGNGVRKRSEGYDYKKHYSRKRARAIRKRNRACAVRY